MEKIGKALFNLQRFQIIQTKLNPETSDCISDRYAFAWYASLYPIMDESPVHEDLEPYFKISKENVDTVSKFADEEWLKKKYYSFYEYEDMYRARISRGALIDIFTYMYLKGGFDEVFWDKLLSQSPTEATAIMREVKFYLP